jgi:hypothetical protein
MNQIIDQLIEDLEKSICVSSIAIDDPNKGYPYAYGYSSSMLKQTVDQLKSIQFLLNEKHL